MTICIGVLSLLFFFKKKSSTRIYLIPLFLIVLCHILFFYGYLHQLRELTLVFLLLTTGTGFILGPLIYCYSKTLMEKEFQLKRKHLYHLFLFGFFWIFFTVPYTINLFLKEAYFEYVQMVLDILGDTINLFESLAIFVYLILCYRLWKRHQQVTKKEFADLEYKDLYWLRNMMIGLGGVLFFDMMVIIYESTFGTFSWNSGYLTIVAIVILLIYLTIYGIRQTRVLVPDFLLEVSEVSEELIQENRQAYHLTNISKEEIAILQNKVSHSLKKDRVYLEEELTLSSWANSLGISAKKLSELLNLHMGITFYDLINQYRVDEVKNKIKSTEFEHLTLLAIAYESGFRSKTSFNRVFKQIEGCSPSQYKKKNTINSPL